MKLLVFFVVGIVALILIATVISAVTGSTSDPSPVGSWAEISGIKTGTVSNGTTQWQFYKDGAVTVKLGALTYNGTWRKINSRELNIHLGSHNTFPGFRQDGSTLKLTANGGGWITFRRIS